MELYRSELINLYRKVQSCTLKEASDAWRQGTVHFNETFYNIMNYMVTDEKCKKYMNVLISRNPCIPTDTYLKLYILIVLCMYNTINKGV